MRTPDFRRATVLSTLAATIGATPALADDIAVVSVAPTARTMTAAPTTTISVTFDRPLDTATVTTATFWAFGRWSGAAAGTISFSGGDTTATLTPSGPFTHGESVMVILSNAIAAEDGSPMRAGGYSFQFWTRSLPAALDFLEIDEMTTRTQPNQRSRAYGGIASDMNNDDFMDITIVNEDTADLRVFLNKADGTGLFDDFLEPPSPVGNRASPSEPHDFDRDGHTDICVADINDDTVSVLLGNGDGTFATRQILQAAGDPRGIAAFDVDGDGDADVVNTNASSSNLSLFLNDGTGAFGTATFFDAGVSGEWSLAAADMNEDGLLDLVVGGSNASQIVVLTSDGDGTFTAMTPVAAGGRTWMLVCGDVNGDGSEDIATVNGTSSNARILLGQGNGQLTPSQTITPDPFPLATDLADLDGDGDLDWITSSFNGNWMVWLNDGAGNFPKTRDLEFVAPDAASCSLPFDIDNDGDLDLALIDELEDVVIIMENTGTPCVADLDGSGDVGFGDLLAVLAAWGPCKGDCPADLDGSGDVGFSDVLIVLSSWGAC